MVSAVRDLKTRKKVPSCNFSSDPSRVVVIVLVTQFCCWVE